MFQFYHVPLMTPELVVESEVRLRGWSHIFSLLPQMLMDRNPFVRF